MLKKLNALLISVFLLFYTYKAHCVISLPGPGTYLGHDSFIKSILDSTSKFKKTEAPNFGIGKRTVFNVPKTAKGILKNIKSAE